jgi:hypothetical protein
VCASFGHNETLQSGGRWPTQHDKRDRVRACMRAPGASRQGGERERERETEIERERESARHSDNERSAHWGSRCESRTNITATPYHATHRRRRYLHGAALLCAAALERGRRVEPLIPRDRRLRRHGQRFGSGRYPRATQHQAGDATSRRHRRQATSRALAAVVEMALAEWRRRRGRHHGLR